jgi:TctA family transporter
MLSTVINLLILLLIGLFIRLGWHRYTDNKVYKINVYVLLFLLGFVLLTVNIVSVPLYLGFFSVDILYYLSAYTGKLRDYKRILAKLMRTLPQPKRKTK